MSFPTPLDRFINRARPLLPVLAALAFASPGRAGAREAERPLRVMTFNIHYGADAGGRPNLRAAAALIRALDPDVAAVQEVDRRFGLRSLWRDQAAWLGRALDMEWVFAATLDRRPGLPGCGEYGIAIFSRLPILSACFLPLPGVLERRGVLLAWIGAEEGAFPVACTHLGLSSADRRLQIDAILAWLPRAPNLLLLGDFNAEADAPEMAEPARELVDLQAACGRSHEETFIYRGTPVRIDYIFAGPAWRALDCRPMPSRVSDHYPVVAEITRISKTPTPGQDITL